MCYIEQHIFFKCWEDETQAAHSGFRQLLCGLCMHSPPSGKDFGTTGSIDCLKRGAHQGLLCDNTLDPSQWSRVTTLIKYSE